MQNSQIAQIFQTIAHILEIQGDSRFRINSYERAAQIISNYPYDLYQMWRRDPLELETIPGIGEALAQKISELCETGRLKYLEKLLEGFDKGLLEILKLRGLGPKKVKLFYDSLGIVNMEMLKEAAEKGQLRELPRMGEKSEKEVLAAIEEFQKYSKRSLLPDALTAAENCLDFLKKNHNVTRGEYAGSLRRRKETIGDIDILVTGKNHDEIIEHFCKYPEVDKIIAKGPTKASAILKTGMQADLRVLKDSEFGAAWHYFTGSKEHNVALRTRAIRMGFKLSEYGLFQGEKRIAGKAEKEIFHKLRLPFIDPEIRENRGEIEAAEVDNLPKLIELEDLQGDLHMHSTWSDGKQSIKEMAEAAQKRGFKYIAITDHSRSLRVATGLDEKRIIEQMKEIDELNKQFKNFKIYKGSEVDILEDGSLDFPDEILAQLDIVIASVHSKFRLPKQQQTERVMKALENKHLTILGHPTGRLLNQREPIEIDMEKIFDTAKKHKKVLEINSNPHRLDLNDVLIKLAKEKGLKLAINSDAHHSSQFELLKFGIFQARRGWIEKKDILNTSPCLF